MLQDLRRYKEVRLRRSSKLGGLEEKGGLLVAFVGGYRLVEMVQLLTHEHRQKQKTLTETSDEVSTGQEVKGKLNVFIFEEREGAIVVCASK